MGEQENARVVIDTRELTSQRIDVKEKKKSDRW